MSKKTSPSPAAPASAPEPEPLARGPVELLLVVGAVLTCALVGLLFQLDVNRVFDVPKALALKVGGGSLFLAWLLYGLFVRGYPWRSARLFAAPVAALAAAVAISTALSLDPATSLYGVYERQFGLQGFLGCVGLFFVTATGLSGKRGAVFGLGCLALVGGIIGTYALLQTYGHDPFPFFFQKPHTKVYSFLGNATFAGNALALIFPISTLLALIAAARTVGTAREPGDLPGAAGAGIAGLRVLFGRRGLPGWGAASGESPAPGEVRERHYWFGVALGVMAVLGAAALGSHGPRTLRVEGQKAQRRLDAFAAGGLAAAALGIAIGLFFTRTRGAWVGTGVAVAAGLVLLPTLFADAPALQRRLRLACWGSLAALVLAFGVFVAQAERLCPPDNARCMLVARTIRSIPAAFDPNRSDFGKGQGTRRYLWGESPRVLTHHHQTLARLHRDQADLAAHVLPDSLPGLTLPRREAPSPEALAREVAWRDKAVWLFGIGIETYRYAFMSHKSKRLEALDPMTNHDNPHNNYLYVLASFGLVGLAAYLWLLWRLLSVAFLRFAARPRRLLVRRGEGFRPAMVTGWRVLEEGQAGRAARVALETPEPRAVASALEGLSELGAVAGQEEVLVTGPSARAILEAAASVKSETIASRTDRAMAFGVVTSFFSYAVYSIAGFDSVACSVFLFFLLGCAAAYLQPNGEEPRRPLGTQILRQLAAWRGRDLGSIPSGRPLALSLVLAAVGVPLLGHTVISARRIYRAEQAFVAQHPARSQVELAEQKIERAKEAIRINGYESYYKQSLGNAYADAARLHRSVVAQLGRDGKGAQAQSYEEKARRYAGLAETALFAALDHTWAPENVFISMFQARYGRGDMAGAEEALERGLEHSPHLGAVRANLAVLKLERGAHQAALADCRWVLEVDPRSALALRTCGKASAAVGELPAAERYLERAAKASPKDPSIARALADVRAQQQAETASAAP